MSTKTPQALWQAIISLDLEEKILNTGSIIAIIGVFLPWLSGEWLGGDSIAYSGFSFFTAFLGTFVFLLHVFLVLVSLVPMTGGPILLKKRFREPVRLAVATQATVLLLAALSVLMKVTLEFSRMEVRFGIYFALLGSIASTIYAFILYQEHRKIFAPELFRHPEDVILVPEVSAFELADVPPPPPPPPAPEPEDHPLALHDHR